MSNPSIDNDTIIAPLTPNNSGSVSLIRISGMDAISVCNNFFEPHDLVKHNGGRFFYGRLKNLTGSVVDEVILYLFKAPESFTGENVIEISCHNNNFIIDDVIGMFLNAGCRLAEPGEFSKRAFLNNKIDLVQAEAIAELISATSKTGTKNALKVLDGDLSKKLNDLKERIIKAASLLELDLDFSEEDIEIVSNEEVRQEIDRIRRIISELVVTYNNSKVYRKGVEVLLAGRPNVGKSSLMNAMLNKDRVIVSNIPGTTRDLVHEDILINDVLIRLIDTAGLRFTEDIIESEGVNRSKKLLKESDFILFIIDLSEPLNREEKTLLTTLVENDQEKLILVGNKSDLDIDPETRKYFFEFDIQKLTISAKKSENIDELKSIMSSTIKQASRETGDDIFLTNVRQVDILRRVESGLSEASQALTTNIGLEFISVLMRDAIDAFSELTGKISTDDILNSIFRNFCIGK